MRAADDRDALGLDKSALFVYVSPAIEAMRVVLRSRICRTNPRGTLAHHDQALIINRN